MWVSTKANNLDKLLKVADPESVALYYKVIISMKLTDRKAFVKVVNVVYVAKAYREDGSEDIWQWIPI